MLEWFDRIGYSADIAGLERRSAARSRSFPTRRAAMRDQMGGETQGELA